MFRVDTMYTAACSTYSTLHVSIGGYGGRGSRFETLHLFWILVGDVKVDLITFIHIFFYMYHKRR